MGIKRRFDREDIFRNHRLTSKFCSVNHLVIIERLLSPGMSLASLYNHLCHFPKGKIFFQIPVTLRSKTIFEIKATISF